MPEYDKNERVTVWDLKIPKIKAYLDELNENNKLPVNDLGKLNRMHVMRYFGLPENQSTYTCEIRTPDLKKLFSEYDEIIKNGAYSQYKGDVYEEALIKLLSGEIVLSKNKRILSRKWMSENLGISTSLLLGTPKLKKIWKEKEKEIHNSQLRGETKKSFKIYGVAVLNIGATPYSEKHDRVFDFSELIDCYSLEFSEYVGTAFIIISNNLASPKSSYERIKHFLIWIASHDKELSNRLSNSLSLNSEKYERACLCYKQELVMSKNEKLNLSWKKSMKFNLAIITKYGKAGVLPKFKFSNSRRNLNLDVAHRPSVLEANYNSEHNKIEKILLDAAKYRGIDIDNGQDTKAFINTLLVEKEKFEDTSDDLTEAMLEITKRRLDSIKMMASERFNNWKDKRDSLQSILSNSTHSSEFIYNNIQIHSDNRQTKIWKDFIKLVFPLHDPDVTLSNILTLIIDKYNGICPSSKNGEQLWNKIYSKVGGINEVQEYILPTREIVSAANTLYLCESGANVAVGLSLENDCLSKSDVPGHSKVIGIKEKALEKPIFSDLKNSLKKDGFISATQSFEYILRANTKYSNNKLFTYASSGELKELTEFNYRNDFKDICNHSSYLRSFNLVPSMLRPTVLLELQLKDPMNFGAVQIFANHEDSSTTFGYTGRLPFRAILEQKILGYMQSIEVLVINETRNKIKIHKTDKLHFSKKLENAQATGLGVFCRDRKLIDKRGSEYKCVSIEDCVQCKHDRMVVIADINSISKMILWKESLENNEKKWLDGRYDRWENIWIPWLSMFTVVLDNKMSRGRLLEIKKEAEKNVSILKSDESFIPPKPW